MKTLTYYSISLLLAAMLLTSFTNKGNNKVTYVIIETKFGPIKAMLYNETPKHRDNFIKLVNEGFYDSLLFHRVIKNFMIQGGDPGSKNAPANKPLGSGGPGYKIDAEFVDGLFHKKGALAAAREGDQVNPEKQSSGSQFYIVMGQIINNEMLANFEEQINFPKRRQLVFDYVDKPENAAIKTLADSLQRAQKFDEINQLFGNIAQQLEPEYQKLDLFHFTPQMIEAYTTVGGTPHLDNQYTVFGQVVEGLNIIDSIANVKTNRADRPIDDIIMKIKIVK